jgi:tetratricopeptide (TPR) repeat protein
VASKLSGAAIGIWGEPGIGKTHALQTALRGLPCRYVIVQANTPDRNLIQVMPDTNNLPTWAERTLEQVRAGKPVEAGPLAEALGALISRLSPFVLAPEDLHEATLQRQKLWKRLAEIVARTRGCGLAVTSRTPPPEPFSGLHLGSLPDATITSLLETEAGAPLPAEATAWIGVQVRGNPLFALEYFRHLTRLGFLWSDGRRWRWRLPEQNMMPNSVEALIQQQLQATIRSDASRRVLGAMALLQPEASDTLLTQVGQVTPSELEQTRQEFALDGILLDRRFVHPLYRELALAQLSRPERTALAQRAITALEPDDPVTAADYLDAAQLSAAEASALLDRALEAARQAGHRGQAARLLARRAAFSDSAQRCQLTLEAARLMREVNLGEALELARQALQAQPAALEATLLTAELLAALGKDREAEDLLEDARNTPSNNAPELAACLFEVGIKVKHLSHDYNGVLNLWQAHESVPEMRTKVPLVIIARAFVQLRRFDEADTVLNQALSVPKLTRLELSELLYVRAFLPYFAGNNASSEVGFGAFLHILSEFDDGSLRYREMRAGTHQLRAYARNALGRPVEAAQDIGISLSLAADIGDASHYAQLQSELGLYLLESGEYTRAEEVLLESREVLERVGHLVYLTMLERITARLYLEWGVPHGAALALRHARTALGLARQADHPAFIGGALFVAGWAEALHGRTDQAMLLTSELEALKAGPLSTAYSMAAAWVRGLALERQGNPQAAIKAWQGVASASRPMQLGPSLERMLLELDRVTNNLESARARHAVFRGRGAWNAARIAERYFPELARSETINSTPPTTQVRVLGPVMVGHQPISERTRKGKEMLALLLEARALNQGNVSDMVLRDTLYPDMKDEKASSALKQLVYRLRSSFGNDLIVRSGDGYALGRVGSDAEQYLETHDSRLWRGPYLVDLGESWPSSLRERLNRVLRAHIVELLETDPAESLRLGRVLIASDPYDRTLLRLTVQAAAKLEDRSQLQDLYARARASFMEIGESLPETWEAFLKTPQASSFP